MWKWQPKLILGQFSKWPKWPNLCQIHKQCLRNSPAFLSVFYTLLQDCICTGIWSPKQVYHSAQHKSTCLKAQEKIKYEEIIKHCPTKSSPEQSGTVQSKSSKSVQCAMLKACDAFADNDMGQLQRTVPIRFGRLSPSSNVRGLPNAVRSDPEHMEPISPRNRQTSGDRLSRATQNHMKTSGGRPNLSGAPSHLEPCWDGTRLSVSDMKVFLDVLYSQHSTTSMSLPILHFWCYQVSYTYSAMCKLRQRIILTNF